jgi:hypothetical protein
MPPPFTHTHTHYHSHHHHRFHGTHQDTLCPRTPTHLHAYHHHFAFCVKTHTLPLLRGLAQFWSCWLVKVDDASHPDGWIYADWDDCMEEAAESGDCQDPVHGGVNPSAGVAFLHRLFTVLPQMATASSGVVVPPEEQARWHEIATHLPPYPTANRGKNGATIWVPAQNGSTQTQAMFGFYPLWPAETGVIFALRVSALILPLPRAINNNHPE